MNQSEQPLNQGIIQTKLTKLNGICISSDILKGSKLVLV